MAILYGLTNEKKKKKNPVSPAVEADLFSKPPARLVHHSRLVFSSFGNMNTLKLGREKNAAVYVGPFIQALAVSKS